jgi:N-methylhydantoinase A
MEAEGREILESEGVIKSKHRYQRTLDMRYLGQGFELNIETEIQFDESKIKNAMKDFHDKHEEIYGYSEEGESIEIVNAKLRAIGLLDSPKLKPRVKVQENTSREERRVFFENYNDWFNVKIFDRNDIGFMDAGPAIIEQYDSTIVVYPDWIFMPDDLGNLILRREQL